MKIGPQILTALRDCASCLHGSYSWKRKSMEKAVVLGLAQEIQHNVAGYQTAFVLTEAGYAALAEAKAKAA